MSAPEDTLGAALRDFALDQIAQVDIQLARAGAWQHNGVHRARKAIARLRAVIVLLRKSALEDRSIERRLRDFARGLSELRDTQAALATAKSLRERRGTLAPWREIAQELKVQRERALSAALMADPGCAAHRNEVADLRSAIAAIAWTRLRESEVSLRLARSGKRAHHARLLAIESNAEEPRHQLRRRCRRLLLQIDLLHAIAHAAARPHAAAAARGLLEQAFGAHLKRGKRKRLVEKLGWEQDLRVLRRSLPTHLAAPNTKASRDLRELLVQAQSDVNEHLT
jgi:hypothetical protein